MRTASPVISSELLRRGHQIPFPPRAAAALALYGWRPHHAWRRVPNCMAAAGRLELLVSPGLKKVIDYFAYAVSGVVLVAGATYGLQRLAQSKPAPPQPATAASTIPPSADSATSEAPATEPDQAVLPDARPAISPTAEDADRAAQRAEQEAAAEQAAFARDQATYYALQKNCYEAANNNQNGEYPELQASACNRYAQFAYARNWDTGTLPAYGQPAPQAPAPQDTAAGVQPEPAAPPPQVIILEQNYGRDRQGNGFGNGYHHNEQSGGNKGQGQRQIGPNYPLPHPQQPPPVSQQQAPHNQMRPAPRPQN